MLAVGPTSAITLEAPVSCIVDQLQLNSHGLQSSRTDELLYTNSKDVFPTCPGIGNRDACNRHTPHDQAI